MAILPGTIEMHYPRKIHNFKLFYFLFFTDYCKIERDHNNLVWPSIEIENSLQIPCSSVPILKSNFTQFGLEGNFDN